MLNAVSLEDTQDRSARTILTPWLKFLWDAYRSILDLLRSNSKLEQVYFDVAHDGMFRIEIIHHVSLSSLRFLPEIWSKGGIPKTE